ncbi:hypothetical protein AVEN_258567-1 [Araneus ventricosus]|uniref:Uncharacterized protein n=1 Tax=Araneus ventricosus TaxID=182803 RepID=A0A4Y2TJB4_ARAVE|nr:hypothetical protein AVEN_258567-1 [Araneus ventricosus]
MFGSDVPIVLTSIVTCVSLSEVTFQCTKKVKVRWGKIGAEGRVIQSLPSQATNAFFCVPCCVGSSIIVQEQDTQLKSPSRALQPFSS